jgi:hypothetical protein
VNVCVRIKIGSINCKGLRNNEKYVKMTLENHDIVFVTETWIGEWEPILICEIRKLNAHIITTNNKKKNSKTSQKRQTRVPKSLDS